jgi:hypothetical protein
VTSPPETAPPVETESRPPTPTATNVPVS